MTELLIGAGGWAYFHVPGLRPLEAYSQAFNFVEVNSTFYEIPSFGLVKSWRQRVPRDFEFAVRCHRDVTHKHQLEPVEDAVRIFDTMIRMCSILGSRFLVLETSSRLSFKKGKIESMRNFFEAVDPKGVRIVWEPRRNSKPVPPRLMGLMRQCGIVPSIDLSKENPPVEFDVVYTRIFGKGQHNIYQFTDEELTEIDEKIARTGSSTAAVSFHNVRMYKDAARFKVYKETGKFPAVTNAKGQQSLRAVLEEDAKFPATRSELTRDQGWKVIDITENRRVHASTLLQKLPTRRFRSIEEVLLSLPEI